MLIEKYYIALTAYYGAKKFSTCLNTFRWLGLAWAILFLINQMWLQGGFVILAFFATGEASVRLDPFTALAVSSKRNLAAAEELEVLKSIYERINSYWLNSLKEDT